MMTAERSGRTPGLVRVLVEGRGATAKYKDVSGPDGRRYRKWCREWPARMAEKFGLCIVDDKKHRAIFGDMGADHRRRMRNARKQERRAAR